MQECAVATNCWGFPNILIKDESLSFYSYPRLGFYGSLRANPTEEPQVMYIKGQVKARARAIKVVHYLNHSHIRYDPNSSPSLHKSATSLTAISLSS